MFGCSDILCGSALALAWVPARLSWADVEASTPVRSGSVRFWDALLP